MPYRLYATGLPGSCIEYKQDTHYDYSRKHGGIMSVPNKRLKLATPADSGPMLEIYTPYVLKTPVTFEIDVPTPAQFSERILKISATYPWVACEIDGRMAGYAYAAQHHERAAYQWSVNLSVYIEDRYQRKGLGRVLYSTLFDILGHLGYYTGLACITSPNPQSEKFHEAFGFKPVGIYHNVGFKLGEWHDVIWYELPLREPSKNPSRPLDIRSAGTEAINAILQRNAGLITI